MRSGKVYFTKRFNIYKLLLSWSFTIWKLLKNNELRSNWKKILNIKKKETQKYIHNQNILQKLKYFIKLINVEIMAKVFDEKSDNILNLFKSFEYFSDLWEAKGKTKGKYDHFISFYSAQILWEILLNLKDIKEKYKDLYDKISYKLRILETQKLKFKLKQSDIEEEKKELKKAIDIFCTDTINDVIIEVDEQVKVIKPISDEETLANYYESIGICYAIRSKNNSDFEKANYCYSKAKEYAYKVRSVSPNQFIYSEKQLREILVDAYISEIEELEYNLKNFTKETSSYN